MFPDVGSHRSSSRSTFLLILTLFFILISLPSNSLGQAESPKTTATQTTATQTTVVDVNEVSLNMVVRTKNGKLVADLKPEDIAVSDGGAAVKITSLRLVKGTGGDHLLTMLFDRLDNSAGRNAQEIAARVLKMVPPEGFFFCVMKADGRLLLYHDFTSDRTVLSKPIQQASEVAQPGELNGAEAAEKRLFAIARTGSDEAGTRVPPKERANAEMLMAALQDSQRVVQEQHTQPGLAGLLALSRAEQRIPGRKTILYFAQGLQSDFSLEDRLRDIIGAANRAGVSIYAIDANALTAQADQSLVAMTAMGGARAAAAQGGPGPTFNATTLTPLPQGPAGLGSMVANQMERYETGDPNGHKSPLAQLADSTGGAYVPSGGDIKKPLHRMIEDMTTYYEASYASPIENYDGQFRPIAVKPVRAGLQISSRAGYFALPPASSEAIRPFEAPLQKMLAGTQLPSDVAFRARVLRLGELPAGNQNTLVVEVPMSALDSRDDPNANLYSLRVSILAQIKNQAGAIIDHFGEDVPRHGSLSSKGGAQPGFITMQRHFDAEPGQYVLEVALLDQNSGKAGALRQEFEIPGGTAGPFLSDLSLVRRVDPVPEEADPDEPMRYGKGKVVPSAFEQVMQGTKELSFFFMVHPDATSSEQPRLEMEVLKSGEPITQVPLTLRKTTGPGAIPYLASIQSAGLPPGDYSVIERLAQGGKTAERNLAFRIEGNEPAATSADAAAGPSKDEVEATTSGLQLPSGDGPSGHGLVITSLPPTAVAAPTTEQLQTIIEDARKRALDYAKRLPNFICVEVTNRSVDASGNGRWKHRDSIAEMLSYHDSQETRTTLEVDGKRSSLKRADMNSTWPLSVGEFGAMLNLVFQPSSKTEFDWKEAATMGDGSGTVQVLDYRVAPKDATIVLSQGNDEVAVGFHGLVYIDASTGGVRRVTLEADQVPHTFAVHQAAMTVDYDYVAISARDYLLPVRSTVSLEKGHRKIELNEITFRNYRRFASRAKMKLLQ